jgi:hypothetical protein
MRKRGRQPRRRLGLILQADTRALHGLPVKQNWTWLFSQGSG